MDFQNEKVIEEKICKQCDTSFSITDTDGEFYEKVSPTFGGKKYHIPTPKLCPDCRQQRRLSFRNERKLYRRKCDFNGKEIISMYSPDKAYTVYDQEVWWSDKWNALDYGKEFNFNKTFFEQFEELIKTVPQISLLNSSSENTEYANYTHANKNCYLCFAGMHNNYCSYSKDIFNSEESIDGIYIHSSKYCYECIDCVKCYKVLFSKDCINCGHGYFLYDCENCNNCFGCIGLRNKNYCFLNIEYSKEEYEKKLNEFLKDNSWNEIISKVDKIIPQHSLRANQNKNTLNCYGDYILNSKNCYSCFECDNIEDSKFLCNAYDSKSCYDTNNVDSNSQLIYEGSSIAGYNLLFSFIVWFSESCYYSMNIHKSENCFGCIGLRNKSYCILNKQYTKEEYEKLVPQIIEHMIKTGEWGEFFPSSLSPFGYNETVAQEYFPLSRPGVIPANAGIYKNESNHLIDPRVKHEDDKGSTFLHGAIFNWSDYEAPFPKVEKVINVETYCNTSLLDNANNVPDDILNWAIECEITKKPFRIIKQELEFYRKHNLPIPRKHPDQRHLERMQLRNPRRLFTRHCDKCSKEIQTTYAPERPEIVYCEECYNREVY